MMKIRCVSNGNYYRVSLKVGKVYDVISQHKNWVSIIDETGEEYGFPMALFEVVED